MPIWGETMSAVTQCPKCNTRFRVNPVQLGAYRGMVRCGLCQEIFNAARYLRDGELNLQPIIPLTQKEAQREFVESLTKGAPITHNKFYATHPAVDRMGVAVVKPRFWWFWAAAILLFVSLVAQTAYFYRVELVANFPGTKPVLTLYCELLDCSIPLPQKLDQLTIESFSLVRADPQQASVITLDVSLRNHALYAQAYPDLELALTSSMNATLARRIFRPSEYLKVGEDEGRGLSSNTEMDVRLLFSVVDLNPSGYHLDLVSSPLNR